MVERNGSPVFETCLKDCCLEVLCGLVAASGQMPQAERVLVDSLRQILRFVLTGGTTVPVLYLFYQTLELHEGHVLEWPESYQAFKVPLKRVLFILKVRIAQLEMWLSTVESGQGRCADHVLLASVKY